MNLINIYQQVLQPTDLSFIKIHIVRNISVKTTDLKRIFSILDEQSIKIFQL